MQLLDQKQHDTAEWLVTESLNASPGPSAIINLAGAVGSGKTSVLRLAEGMFRQRGLVPVFLSASSADAETSAIVLAEAGDCLARAGSLNGTAEILRDPNRRWLEKFDAVTAVIDNEPDRFAILCDEPAHWFRQSASEIDDTPDHHARLVSDWIFKLAQCRRVISGSVSTTSFPNLKQTRAPRIPSGGGLLHDNALWGYAADLASGIVNLIRRPIEYRSVMEIRLLVAWAWLFGPDRAARQCVREFSVTSLLEELLNSLEASAQSNNRHRAVCQAMARLALSRVDLPGSISSLLMSDLSPLEGDIVRGCFCEEWPDAISLHPLVAYEVTSRARDRKREGTNQVWRLASAERSTVHTHLFNLANQTLAGKSFRTDLEALHHGVLSDQIQDIAGDSRLHFVEQLHEIGRELSYVFRQHKQAADVFRLALSLDMNNAYSHHYLAFNLDWIAESEDEVETHYKKAIELQPEHPWWWSRWISYLATRGRFKVAGKQWRDALDALSVTEDATPDWIYLSLHRWVARWMLHWSNLDFAENVLRSIPSSLQSDASVSRLNDLLTALRFAESGRAVFPLSVPASEWWSPHPHTDLPNELDGQRLLYWYPARVQHVEEGGDIFVMYAKQPVELKSRAEFVDAKVPCKVVRGAAFGFDSQCLHEGSFVELGYYGENQTLRIGLHPEGPLNDPDLIPLVPPPDRWYRRAVEASWADPGDQH